MKLNVIDLFAGCGGLIDGFLQSGKFKTLAAVDWEIAPIKTLTRRMEHKWKYDASEKRVFHFDIQRTHELLFGFDDPYYGMGKGLVELVGDNKVDLVIGGPPCQAYSMAGRVQDEFGMQNDYRNYLFESYIKIVDYFKPSAFVFENVEGILSAKPGGIPIVDRIKEAFNKVGYEIIQDLRRNTLLDTSFYDVPQRRKRVILFAIKKGWKNKLAINNFYSSMDAAKKTLPTTAKLAFEGLPKIYPLKSTNLKRNSHSIQLNGSQEVLNHQPRFHNKRDVEIFRLIAEDIRMGINKYGTVQSLIDLYKEKTGKISKFHKYHVIREDKPSNTIPAHIHKDGLRHIHPDPLQARTITVREAARLQTFDDDFEFFGGKGDQYKMVGNAVPPKFSKLIAEKIWEIIK
jgi:DNA (cytosine-5)-methyltransferase 1